MSGPLWSNPIYVKVHKRRLQLANLPLLLKRLSLGAPAAGGE